MLKPTQATEAAMVSRMAVRKQQLNEQQRTLFDHERRISALEKDA